VPPSDHLVPKTARFLAVSWHQIPLKSSRFAFLRLPVQGGAETRHRIYERPHTKGMKNIEPMVPESELRRIYPVSRRTLCRWINKGCPSRLIGGRRLFRPTAVERWLGQFDEGNWGEGQ
jgi:hypothetical protein